MSDDKNPWGGGNSDPWNSSSDGKVVYKKTFKKGGNDNFKPFNSDIKPKWVIIALLAIWLASGFYQVQPAQEGVVLRFGEYAYSTSAGLHYHLPFPIEKVYTPNVTRERSVHVGGEDNSMNRNAAGYKESYMLTGDENIVDINFAVIWNIKSAKDYLFSMRNPDGTVSVAAQSAMREVVGQSDIQDILTGDRDRVEEETKNALQNVLDEFHSGINVIRVKLQKADPPKEVVDAFNEVQRAKTDKERFKNEAEAYRNDIIPVARGEAEKIIQNAEAYKAEVINKAKGEANRYDAIYKAYKQAKTVTVKRMYLDAMEEVVKNSNKVIIDPSKSGANVLPYLPLNSVK